MGGARLAFLGRRGCRGRLDLRDDRADTDRLTLGDGDLDELALERRGDLGVDLVGHDLDDRLVALDEVPLVLEPFVDRSLGHGFAQLRHLDLRNAHAGSSSLSGRSRGICFLEATPRIELGMEVLQTSALPLGYVAAVSDSILRSPPTQSRRREFAGTPR